MRLGIGHPGEKERVTGHVLADFAKADRAWLEPLLAAVADAFPLLVAGDDAGFMNKVALAMKPLMPGTGDPVRGTAAPQGQAKTGDGL